MVLQAALSAMHTPTIAKQRFTTHSRQFCQGLITGGAYGPNVACKQTLSVMHGKAPPTSTDSDARVPNYPAKNEVFLLTYNLPSYPLEQDRRQCPVIGLIKVTHAHEH